MIKAIETVYNGYRFRSRLEARWAVFFDALGVQWMYEHEGFDLGSLGYYLPDFWLPQVSMWAEVKPSEFTKAEWKKALRLATTTDYPVLLLIGVPSNKAYSAILPMEDELQDYLRAVVANEKIAGGQHQWARQVIVDQGFECEFCLTNVHGYVTDEHRFYSSPGGPPDDQFRDTARAARIARQARFEHGESPWTSQQRKASTIAVPG